MSDHVIRLCFSMQNKTHYGRMDLFMPSCNISPCLQMRFHYTWVPGAILLWTLQPEFARLTSLQKLACTICTPRRSHVVYCSGSIQNRPKTWKLSCSGCPRYWQCILWDDFMRRLLKKKSLEHALSASSLLSVNFGEWYVSILQDIYPLAESKQHINRLVHQKHRILCLPGNVKWESLQDTFLFWQYVFCRLSLCNFNKLLSNWITGQFYITGHSR